MNKTLLAVTLVVSSAAFAQTNPFDKPSAQKTVQGKGRVLVLDDEEALRMLVTHALTPLGFSVTESADTASCIRLYDEAMKNGARWRHLN